MTEIPFVLVTSFGTIVCVDPMSGVLVHEPIEACNMNLAFKWGEGKLAFVGAFPLPTRSEELSKLVDFPASVEFILDNKFGIKIGGLYMCADGHSNSININRRACYDWEQFSPLSITDAYGTKLARSDDNMKLLIRQRSQYEIPKAIHQIFISDLPYQTQLPEKVAQKIEELKIANPGWQHTIWTKKEIHDAIYDWYGYEVLDLYLHINPRYPAAQADLFRYLCIYKLGGVYLDLKSGASVPFERIFSLEDQYVLSQWNNAPGQKFQYSGIHEELGHIPGGEFQNWHIIASSGHPFLQQAIIDVLSNIRRRAAGKGKQGVLSITGPIPYTLAIEKIKKSYPYKMIDAEHDGLIFNTIGTQPKAFAAHYSKLNDDVIL